MLDSKGPGFVTRLQLNKTDDAFLKKNSYKWERLDDNMLMKTKAGLGRTRYILLSEKLRSDVMERYYQKLERNRNEMEIISKNIDKNKKPRKKHGNSNWFVDMKPIISFFRRGQKEEAIEHAFNQRITGWGGLFVLFSNLPLTTSEILEIYRSRNDIESSFRDQKHGIDWRPTRCTSEDAIPDVSLSRFCRYFVC
jgi:transposase